MITKSVTAKNGCRLLGHFGVEIEDKYQETLRMLRRTEEGGVYLLDELMLVVDESDVRDCFTDSQSSALAARRGCNYTELMRAVGWMLDYVERVTSLLEDFRAAGEEPNSFRYSYILMLYDLVDIIRAGMSCLLTYREIADGQLNYDFHELERLHDHLMQCQSQVEDAFTAARRTHESALSQCTTEERQRLSALRSEIELTKNEIISIVRSLGWMLDSFAGSGVINGAEFQERARRYQRIIKGLA